MIKIDWQSGVPAYDQIVQGMIRLKAVGAFAAGDQLPSVRSLAVSLGVNPNTVQKAYKLLEEEGLIQSRAGAKSCVVVTERKMQDIRAEILENDAKNAVFGLKMMGVTREEAHALIDTYWEIEE